MPGCVGPVSEDTSQSLPGAPSSVINAPEGIVKTLKPQANVSNYYLSGDTNQGLHLDSMLRNKDIALYTYAMIHVYLAQKKNYPFKIINSWGNILYLPEPIIVNSPEFKWFGTKSISHITEYSRQLTQGNSNIYIPGLSAGPHNTAWAASTAVRCSGLQN